MKVKMFVKLKLCWIFAAVLIVIKCQRVPSIPLSSNSFRSLQRSFLTVPKGRSTSLSDIRIVYYRNSLSNRSSYVIRKSEALLDDEYFDLEKPTVFYIHGYVEYISDESVSSVVGAYLQLGGYNVLALDWDNFAQGNYFNVLLDISAVGNESGKAIFRLLKRGLDINSLHLVTHSLGAHIGAVVGRYLLSRGYTLPRLTGLDPAFPGFFPPLFTPPISPKDAKFVDIIHTDGGRYGSPTACGHVDFWPNEGTPKQPGCLALAIPFSIEHFCSHWRSWRFYAESVLGGNFVARKCDSYDSFLRGSCGGAARMGLQATSDLRGNYYLRTAAQQPYALGERGAV